MCSENKTMIAQIGEILYNIIKNTTNDTLRFSSQF